LGGNIDIATGDRVLHGIGGGLLHTAEESGGD